MSRTHIVCSCVVAPLFCYHLQPWAAWRMGALSGMVSLAEDHISDVFPTNEAIPPAVALPNGPSSLLSFCQDLPSWQRNAMEWDAS